MIRDKLKEVKSKLEEKLKEGKLVNEDFKKNKKA